MSETHEPGAAIRAALEARGCALEAHEGRALAESLIALICAGLVVSAAVHRDADRLSPEDELGQASCGQAHAETAPAYNMGQSKYMERGDRE